MSNYSEFSSSVYVDPTFDLPVVLQPQNALTTANLDVWEGWSMLGGGLSTHAGETVSVEKSIGIAAVFQAVSMISGDIAKLPLDIWRRGPDDSRSKDKLHSAYRAVRRVASPGVHAHKFWRRMMVQALLYNNAYAFIRRVELGRQINLTPLLSDRTAPFLQQDGSLAYKTHLDGKEVFLRPEQVLHVEGVSLDGVAGYEFILAARQALALAMAAEKYAGSFYKNGGRIGGILEVPAAMKAAAKDKLEEGFRRTYEDSEKAFKTVILRENAKFHPGQMTPEETQLIGTRRESVKEVARYFSMQPGKLGEESSRTYNNKHEENRDYIDTTLSNWLVAISAECDLKLLTPRQLQSESHYFEHNTDAFLQADTLSRYQAYELAIRNRFMVPNTAAKKENLPMVEGGDSAQNPNIDPVQPDVQNAHRRLLDSAVRNTAAIVATRAKKAAASGKRFIAWLDGGHSKDTAKVADAVRPVLDAYTAVSGGDGASLTAYVMATLTRDLQERLGAVADTTAETGLREAVDSTLDGFPETISAIVGDLIFGEVSNANY